MYGKTVKVRHCPATVSAHSHADGLGRRRAKMGPNATGVMLREGGPVLRASQETGPLAPLAAFRGERRSSMPALLRPSCRRLISLCLLLLAALVAARPLRAVLVHGTVTDTLGAVVPGATVALIEDGKPVA